MTFKDCNELQNKIDYLLSDVNKYAKEVRHNRHVVDYGDSNSPNGWWLEKNLQKWYDIFTLPQRTVKADARMQTAPIEQPKLETYSQNGVEIKL
jgi:hypothetical protein